jgi:hypothetical protein
MPKPDDRPRIGDVLQGLEEASKFWIPLSQLVVNMPIVDSPTRNSSNPDAEGSTEESETSSLSQLSQTLPPKGDTDDTIPTPTLPDTFIAPCYEVTNNQDPRAYAKDPSESDSEEPSLAILDRVS